MMTVEFQCLDSGKPFIVRDLSPAAMVGRGSTVGSGVGAPNFLLTNCLVYSLTVAFNPPRSLGRVPAQPDCSRHRQDASRTPRQITPRQPLPSPYKPFAVPEAVSHLPASPRGYLTTSLTI
jgi:hypothetical protein